MLLQLFELAANNALQYDPSTRVRLEKLRGKTMVLTVMPINQSISVSSFPEGLEFAAQIPDDSDVHLTATLGALIKITRDGMDDADLQPGELEMSGDPIIGQRFAQAIAGLDVDWEGLLAEHMGEAPAYYLSRAAGTARDVALESRQRFKLYLNRLLTEDLQLLADKDDVDAFLDEVDRLRADADKLSLKLKQLQNRA
ncbi:MAG: hypothetical protein HKN50_01105 [Gammaproteobacteria bacterium]|nr:hypothetical protein [Gammaproteobacteria bacterium]